MRLTTTFKITTFILFTLFPTTFYGQSPCARAEAMGRAYTSVDGDLTTVFFNPAGSATIKGLETDGSFASPGYNEKYITLSTGYKFSKYLIIGMSNRTVDYYEHRTNGSTYSSSHESNSLTISSQPLRNLYIGLNLNMSRYSYIDGQYSGYGNSKYLDCGVIKKFNFLQKENSGQSINIAASISNIDFSKDQYLGINYGGNYQFVLDKHLLIDTLKTLNVLVLGEGEYTSHSNSKAGSAIRAGCEIMLLEILAIRAGYYKETHRNDWQEALFTYGFGLQVPLYKLTNIPLEINFDYTSLPEPKQEGYIATTTKLGNFTTYNLRLTWVINYKKKNTKKD